MLIAQKLQSFWLSMSVVVENRLTGFAVVGSQMHPKRVSPRV